MVVQAQKTTNSFLPETKPWHLSWSFHSNFLFFSFSTKQPHLLYNSLLKMELVEFYWKPKQWIIFVRQQLEWICHFVQLNPSNITVKEHVFNIKLKSPSNRRRSLFISTTGMCRSEGKLFGVVFLRFASWPHLRSYQHRYRLVTLCTHCNFIVLSHWEPRLTAPCHEVPLNHSVLALRQPFIAIS